MLQETNDNCVILYPADDMINDDIPQESLMSAYNPRGGGDEQQPVPRAPRHDRKKVKCALDHQNTNENHQEAKIWRVSEKCYEDRLKMFPFPALGDGHGGVVAGGDLGRHRAQL